MASRYTSYGLNLLRGIIVAKFLGPQMFGVWGFLMLMQQYLSYTSLGLQYSITVELTTTSIVEQEKQVRFMGSAFAMTTVISCGLVLLGFGIQVSEIPLFEKYSFNQYAFVLGVIVGTQHFQHLFTNIYRVHGKLTRIAVSEMVSAVIPLTVVLIFRGSDLINPLLVALMVSGFLSISIYLIRAPFKIVFGFNVGYWKQLLAIGVPLLVYSASFYLITISARTIISIFYPAETMGYYSLANTITTATLLGLNSVGWVIFPDILSRTHSSVPDDLAMGVVRRVNDLYGTSVFLAVFGVILGLPMLFFFLPQYQSAADTLSVLLLSQAILSISFGYNCIAIARKEHLKVAGISMIAALVVTGLSLLAVLFKLNFTWIAVAALVGAFVFTLLQARLGVRLLGQENTEIGFVTGVLPWGSLAATLIFLVGILIGYSTFAGLIGVTIFIITSRRKIEQLGGVPARLIRMKSMVSKSDTIVT